MITRIVLILAAVLAAALVAGGCGAGGPDGGAAGGSSPTGVETQEQPGVPADGTPRIVVTYPILGALVQELVGDTAEVEILMPNGVDPHDWQPSAKNVESVSEADLVVANGLHLEEGLEDALAEAEDAGVLVFRAADHVDLRRIGDGEATDEHGGDEGPGAEDPHIWTDPLAMRAVVGGLAATLEQELGLPIGDRAADLEARLTELSSEVEATLASIPATERKLVTGHESMGYFADRYGFELVGALIPSISPQAEASAAELARLKDQIEEAGVGVIFTEIGTPTDVAEAIADETGATVVELPSHTLPDDGSYFTFVRTIAADVADALAP